MFISIFVFVWLLILVFLNFVFNIYLNRQIKGLKIKTQELHVLVNIPEVKTSPVSLVKLESLFILQEEDDKNEIDVVIIIPFILSVGLVSNNDEKFQFGIKLNDHSISYSSWSSYKLADSERKRLLSAIQKYYNYIYKQEK
jgi:hypothetical protein